MKQIEYPFRIEKKDGFRVIGYRIQTTNKKGEGKKAIPLHWSKFKENRLEMPIMSLANKEPHGLFGINIYNVNATDARVFDYMIAVSSDTVANDVFSEYEVPAMTWAIFPCTLDTIGKTEAQAITKWLPKAKYKPLNRGYITGRMKSHAPDIEYYGSDGKVEVWVAIDA